jgi:hypothetical protein
VLSREAVAGIAGDGGQVLERRVAVDGRKAGFVRSADRVGVQLLPSCAGQPAAFDVRPVLLGILRERDPRKKVAAMFVDSAFGSPIVERLRTLGFDNVHEVSFGAHSPDYHDANWRAYMWRSMKDWLAKGAIPDDEPFALQLCLPGYHINRSNKLVLESKSDLAKRGEASPDDADAFALTFAQHVAPEPVQEDEPSGREIFAGLSGIGGGWMG